MSTDPNTLIPWRRGDPLFAERLSRMQTATTRVEAGAGLSVVETGQSRAVVLGDGSTARQRRRVVRITDATLFAPNRWRYDWTRLRKDDSASEAAGGWVDADDGETGVAFNLREADNTDTVWGIGIDPNDLPEGFTLNHAPLTLIEVFAVTLFEKVSRGGIEWWFDYPNPLKGTCQP
jgi:hypothetical protein